MTLGRTLQNLRKKNTLSQEKLAELVGVSRQAVSKCETGLSNPDTENLIRLAEIFNVSVDELTGRVSVHNEFTEEIGAKNVKEVKKQNTKNKPQIRLHIFGAIISFLVFSLSMAFVQSKSILIILGIVGIVGMMYCISNIMNLIMK